MRVFVCGIRCPLRQMRAFCVVPVSRVLRDCIVATDHCWTAIVMPRYIGLRAWAGRLRDVAGAVTLLHAVLQLAKVRTYRQVLATSWACAQGRGGRWGLGGALNCGLNVLSPSPVVGMVTRISASLGICAAWACAC